MRRYLLRRVLQMIPVIFVVILINFVLINVAPGDPARAIAGEDAPAEYLEALALRYGLDQPVHIRLWRYLSQMVRGDLGFSYAFNRPVVVLIFERLPNTLILVGVSQVLAILLGILVGTYQGRAYPSFRDSLLSSIVLALYSAPVFWTGLIAILVFAVYLGWFPTSGIMSVGVHLSGANLALDRLRHAVLPIGTLSLYNMPTYARLTRAGIIEILGEDYIVTARAKGLRERTIFTRHALRNALLPVISVAGISLGLVFAGALLTETVFAWPGLGRLMYQAVFRRDYPLLMGIFAVTSVCIVMFTLITDIVYTLVDPRVQLK